MQKENREKRKPANAGFTLIEVLIVLAIIVSIGSFVGVNVIKKYQGSKIDTARVQLASYNQALQAYYLQHNVYPTAAEGGLQALVRKPTSGKIPDNYQEGAYFGKKELVKDPWNHDYRYVCDDYQNYTISSDGPDGEPGTSDDVKAD